MKITNKDVIQALELPNTTFYDWKKTCPRLVELLKKGLLAEMLLNEKVFEQMIKKHNKK